MDTTGYAKYEFSGPAAEGFLSRMLANRMPEVGKIVLAPMLNAGGKLIGDFTVARTGPETFYIFGTAGAEDYHRRWWEAHAPASGLSFRSMRSAWTGISIAGPKSRDLLARIAAEDVSNEAFPFMAVRRMDLGMIPALVNRLTFTGDLGYEFWVTADYQEALYDLLLAHGADLGLAHVGVRAVLSMRLEKSWGIWAREYRPIYGPFEAGLNRFVNFKKGDFVGRDAALRERDACAQPGGGGKLKLVTLVVDAADADAWFDEPVRQDGKTVGWVTSGGFGHSVGRSLALAYLPAERVQSNAAFTVDILGEHRAAVIAPEPVFDPTGARMRG
jgi:dimethylglycine dehydrogenase